MASNNVIGLPASDKDFEAHCAVLFANILSDPNVKLVATRGKKQNGIDLIGARGGNPSQPVGIQCKLKTKGAKLDLKEVRLDLSRALLMQPVLTEIYVVTTASDDVAYDQLALTLRQEQQDLGRNVDIQVWGWDELQRRIVKYPDALNAFDPNYSGSTATLVALNEETLAGVQRVDASVQDVRQELSGQLAEIRALMVPADGGGSPTVEKLLNGQLDHIRDLLNLGKPKSALDLTLKLEEQLPGTASVAVQARLMNNLGFAYVRLGENTKAVEAFERGFAINPQDPKSRANHILALVLKGELTEAIAVARQVLAEDPENANAASFAYQAAVLGGEFDPDEFVPESLHFEENVGLNRIAYLRQRDREVSWRAAAELLFKHPGSALAKRVAAEALLDEALSVEKQDPHARRSKLKLAATRLQETWDSVRYFENAADEAWLSVGVNLMTAYRALHDEANVSKIASELQTVAPDNPSALISGAHACILAGQPAEAIAKSERVSDRPERTLVLVMAHSILSRWQEVIDLLTPERLNAIRPEDRRVVDPVLLRARFETGGVEDPKAELEAMAKEWPDELGVAVELCEMAMDFAPELEPEFRQRAVLLLDKVSYFPARVMLAQYALAHRDHEVAIKALDGQVDTTKPNEPLAWLALAFANAPVRPRTHQFFEGLPAEILKLGRYARLAGVAENNRGDLEAAERHFRAALASDPHDARSLVLLYNVLVRQDCEQEAKALIAATDERAMEGLPLERMQLAMILRQNGEHLRSVELGYAVASVNRDDHAIVSKYPPLVLFGKNLPEVVVGSKVVAHDCWFELTGDGCDNVSGIIETGRTPETLSFPPNHPIAKATLGHVVGDEIVVPQHIGPDRRYTLTKIEHRYLWLMRDIMNTWAARFPDAESMAQLSMRDGDVEPVLEIVRKDAEKQESFLESYVTMPVPLEVFAAVRNRSAIEVAEWLANAGKDVATAVGNHQERSEAEEAVRAAAGKGAALDTLTVWTAHVLGLLPAFESHFGRLAITQTTIDTLLELRAREREHVGQEYMTLGFQDGVATREMHSPEETERRIKMFDEAIAAMKRHCQILPVDGDAELIASLPLDDDVLERMFEPVLLARQYGLIFLSDDLRLRQLANQNNVERAAWLQPAARVLRSSELLSPEQYARCVLGLAGLRHVHLSLDGEVLADILDLPGDHADQRFGLAAKFIGGPHAEIVSHVMAVARFMALVWDIPVSSWRQQNACGVLITNLVANRQEYWDILLLLSQAIIEICPAGRVRNLADDYLDRWVRGHFLFQPTSRADRKRAKRKG